MHAIQTLHSCVALACPVTVTNMNNGAFLLEYTRNAAARCRLQQIRTAEDVSLQAGIRRVLPRATLQDHLFEPCGYSLNALEGKAYYTMHVRVGMCNSDAVCEQVFCEHVHDDYAVASQGQRYKGREVQLLGFGSCRDSCEWPLLQRVYRSCSTVRRDGSYDFVAVPYLLATLNAHAVNVCEPVASGVLFAYVQKVNHRRHHPQMKPPPHSVL